MTIARLHRPAVLAAALAFGALAAGPALALTLEEVREAVASVESTGGNVNAHLKDGVVLLEGNVTDAMMKAQIESEVRRLDGVVDVQNNIIAD